MREHPHNWPTAGKWWWGVVLYAAAACSVGLGRADTEIVSRTGSSDRARNYNLRISRLQLRLRGLVVLGLDDNSNRAGGGAPQEQTTTLQCGTEIGAYWPISQDLRLDLYTYVGEALVLSGHGAEGLLIRATNGTTFALDSKVGANGLLSFLDTLSLDTERVGAETSKAPRLRLLNNEAAVQYEHQLSKYLTGTGRIGREDVRALSTAYDHRDRVTHYLALRGDWHYRRENTLWPYYSYRMHTFVRDHHNDADEHEIGLGTNYNPSGGRTRYEVSAGYQALDFDPHHVPEATEDGAGLVAKFVVQSQINRRMNHGLSALYTRRLGTAPRINYTEDLGVGYRYNWQLAERWQFTYLGTYTRSREVAVGGATDNTLAHEVQLAYTYGRFSPFIGFRHADCWSTDADRGYGRNEYFIGMSYDF